MNSPGKVSLVQTLFFITLLATALAMGAAIAHALELPNKMALEREEYFTVQKIYLGWNRLAFLLAVELGGLLGLLYIYRNTTTVRLYVVLALLCLAAAQVVFWMFTFPANQVTANWTIQPENWEALRRQWEYSHLAGAVFQTLALAMLTSALLAAGRPLGLAPSAFEQRNL